MDLIIYSRADKQTYRLGKPQTIIGAGATYRLKNDDEGVIEVVPYLPREISVFEKKEMMISIIKELIVDENLYDYDVRTNSPMAMPYLRTLSPVSIVYSPLAGLSEVHPELHRELLEYADEAQQVMPSHLMFK